ncbi:SprT family protein [Staphylospora marina]|uniref:SprT family protein n=1 Tax=Staphylospora marina TaxID=2490858 RepID=UPI000F5BA666|nr:SprT family protein [Staphylospora marina]
MTDAELQAWVETLSRKRFGRTFRHRAVFNHRLRTTAGRYMLRDHRIEVNPRYLEVYGRETVEGILLHELCHYHLHLSGKGYRHRDRDFRHWLAKVGGLSVAPPLDPRPVSNPVRYRVICQGCRKIYFRKRKIDVNRYVCGSCRGPLRLEPADFGRE